MKLITIIKRVFRKGKHYQVWDTSALSNHFESFKNTLKSRENIKVVIPEGVSHEISVGRRNNDNCKEIYKFIEGNVRNPRLIVAVTPDSTRSWAVDEQVIYTAQQYNERGYTTTLITCDRDQSFRAGLKGLETRLIPAKAGKTSFQKVIEQAEVETMLEPSPVIDKQVEPEKNEIVLKSRMVGKQLWINWDKNLSVYDAKGKRKIPRDESVQLSMHDTIYYKGVKYDIKKVASNEVTLTKI